MAPGLHRRTLLAAAAGAGALAATPTRADAAPAYVTTLADGLDIPWGLDFLPDGSALVTERNRSRVLRVTPDGAQSVVAEIAGVVPYGEGGLLGLAVSPQYATDQRIYLYFTAENDNRVVWATYDGSTLGELNPIITGIPKAKTHNGGGLRFAATGELFLGCGDTRHNEMPQDRTVLGGKILRVDRDGAALPDNPFYGVDVVGDDRVWSLGHRNPQGLAFTTSGELWSAELGLHTWDELNLIVAKGNYGWPRTEGSDGPGGYRDPLVQWHPVDCSPSGMSIIGSHAYVCAMRGESLWKVGLHGPDRGRKERFFTSRFGRLRNVKVAPDRTLWVTTSNGAGADKVLQLRP